MAKAKAKLTIVNDDTKKTIVVRFPREDDKYEAIKVYEMIDGQKCNQRIYSRFNDAVNYAITKALAK